MAEKIGLIDESIRLVKKDVELAERILEARDLPDADLKSILDILRYNVWTTKQFKDLTGLAESTIANKTRPAYKNGELVTELDFCYPFQDLEGTGPKFIIRNEKSEALLP